MPTVATTTESLAKALRLSSGVLYDMEKVILDAIHTIMPPNREFGRWARVRYLFWRKPWAAVRQRLPKRRERATGAPGPQRGV